MCTILPTPNSEETCLPQLTPKFRCSESISTCFSSTDEPDAPRRHNNSAFECSASCIKQQKSNDHWSKQ